MVARTKNLPTLADAKLFDDFVKKWQKRLNLSDWRIEFNDKETKSMACVTYNAPARLAIYQLGSFHSEKITSESLEATALHELLHIFLYDLIEAANSKCTPEELEAAEHKCINVLEKLLRE
jgi:hypothetical protein